MDAPAAQISLIPRLHFHLHALVDEELAGQMHSQAHGNGHHNEVYQEQDVVVPLPAVARVAVGMMATIGSPAENCPDAAVTEIVEDDVPQKIDRKQVRTVLCFPQNTAEDRQMAREELLSVVVAEQAVLGDMRLAARRKARRAH